MDLLWHIGVTLTIFVLIKETISKEIRVSYENTKAPLVMIEKRDATLWLATPREYRMYYEAYFYDDSKDKNGYQEKIFVACPPSNGSAEQLQKEENLKSDNKLSKDSKLLIADEYTTDRSECDTQLVPSIEKSKKYDKSSVQNCGQSRAEIYDVGYPVIKKDDEMDIKFMTIYQVCYSTAEDEGMLYTIHRIVSPDTLLHKFWEFYELDPEATLKTSLDNKRDINIESLYENHYAYQFVGFNDMPTKSWENATLFSINYTFIPKNKDLMRGIITADNYIRLFSKETNKPLTFYSGSYQKMVLNVPLLPCLAILCTSISTQVNSFWRVIMDDEGYAVIMVTQYTPLKCEKNFYICHENRVIVQKYKEGGCTYTCSVNDEIIELLSLPRLKITGVLTLTFPQKTSKSVKNIISIFDFMEKESFMSVLTNVDSVLAKDVPIYSSTPKL